MMMNDKRKRREEDEENGLVQYTFTVWNTGREISTKTRDNVRHCLTKTFK